MRGNIDPVQQRDHARAGRLRHQGARRRWRRRRHRRDVGQVRLRRRAAPRDRDCLQPDVGRRVQAAVAGLSSRPRFAIGWSSTSSAATSNASTSRPMPRLRRCSRPARRCPRTGCRSRSSARSTTLRPVTGLPSIRDADMTLRFNGRTAKVTLGKGIVEVSPGRRLDHLQRRVRGAEHAHEDAAGARALPRRRPGAGRRRTARARPAARIFRRAVRSRAARAARCRRQVTARHAAAARSAAGLDRLRHHRRSCEFQRRQDDVRPEGRGADAAGHGQQPGLRDQGRRARSRGAPAQVEYRKLKGEAEAEVRLQATLDEAARARLGLDLGTALDRTAADASSPAASGKTTGTAASTSKPT